MKKIDPYLIPDTPLDTTGVAFIHISSGFKGGYVIENNSGELIVYSINNITKSNLDIYYLYTYNKKFIYDLIKIGGSTITKIFIANPNVSRFSFNKMDKYLFQAKRMS